MTLALLPDAGLSLAERSGLTVIGVGLVLALAVRVALWNTRRVARKRARAHTAALVADALAARRAGDERGRHRSE